MSENKGALSPADIRHFCKWLDPKRDYGDIFWVFTCFSRQDYADAVKIPYLDEVCFGLQDKGGGCVCEALMTWEKIEGGIPSIRAFSESFAMLTSPAMKKVFQKLMKRNERFTPEEFADVLVDCGFLDMSDRSRDESVSHAGYRGKECIK